MKQEDAQLSYSGKKKVYLFRAAQFYKIGVSIDPMKRLTQIQTGCPIKCEYVGYIPSTHPRQTEKEIHEDLAEFRTFGEWFDLGDGLIRYLIENWNLKSHGNPFNIETEDSIKATESPVLKDVRKANSLVNELDILYQELYDYQFSDHGKASIRRLIVKYSPGLVEECFRYVCTQVSDPDKVFEKLPSTCKNYHKYGRHVPKQAWDYYWKMNKIRSRSDANKFLEIMMIHAKENDTYFQEFFLYQADNSDDNMSDLLDEYEYISKTLESHE